MPSDAVTPNRAGREPDLLALAERAFGRAAGADPIDGNAVRLLLDAEENYPAWLAAIANARRMILFESYIIADDDVGREFAEALARKAREGVQVFAIFDWLGSWGGESLFARLRDAGADVRLFNPLRFTSPLGWLSRDHRKTLAVDGEIGFVSGLCVSSKWLGNTAARLEPWRDTGVEIRGPAVSALERAFAQVWRAIGDTPFPGTLLSPLVGPAVGDTRVRVVSGMPNATGTFRLDLVIAAIAHQHLWLTDAYFVGTAAYVQALAAAARDGVDVRLLVPGSSDIPALSPLSRAGYRPLLEAGVRVFEWNGTMLHAKTAVADERWSRIGSTNLNIASWLGNYELDVAIEDDDFGHMMARQYERDLERATEIVLTERNRVRRTALAANPPEVRRARSGSAGRAAAGALSVGSAIGAALTNRRRLAPAEAGLVGRLSVSAIAVAVVAALWPRVVAWPLAFVAVWIGIAWLAKAVALKRQARAMAASAQSEVVREDAPGSAGAVLGEREEALNALPDAQRSSGAAAPASGVARPGG